MPRRRVWRRCVSVLTAPRRRAIARRSGPHDLPAPIPPIPVDPTDSRPGAEPVDSDRAPAARSPADGGDRGDSRRRHGSAGQEADRFSAASFDSRLIIDAAVDGGERVCRAGPRRPHARADRRARSRRRAGDPREISQHRRRRAVRRWARSQLEAPLRDRMIELADRVILEFRNEAPAIAQVQWEQARDCLAFAQELAPRRSSIAARRAYVDGHLTRIAAGSDRAGLEKAIARFPRGGAAGSRIARSVSRPRAHLCLFAVGHRRRSSRRSTEAEKRGYTRGRREQAQLGDAYRLRAERARAAAARLTARSASNNCTAPPRTTASASRISKG